MPMKKPPHPGDLIRTEVIEALGLSISKAAEILQVRRATLSDLLHGKAALTPEMALRIEKAFGPEMDHLLRMQLAYDVAKTREHALGHLNQAICPGLIRQRRTFPYRSLTILAPSRSKHADAEPILVIPCTEIPRPPLPGLRQPNVEHPSQRQNARNRGPGSLCEVAGYASAESDEHPDLESGLQPGPAVARLQA